MLCLKPGQAMLVMLGHFTTMKTCRNLRVFFCAWAIGQRVVSACLTRQEPANKLISTNAVAATQHGRSVFLVRSPKNHPYSLQAFCSR